jgi:hypothetical protein
MSRPGSSSHGLSADDNGVVSATLLIMPRPALASRQPHEIDSGID